MQHVGAGRQAGRQAGRCFLFWIGAIVRTTDCFFQQILPNAGLFHGWAYHRMLLVLRGDLLLLADLVRGDLLLGYLELVRGDLLLADLVRWDMRRREKLVYDIL